MKTLMLVPGAIAALLLVLFWANHEPKALPDGVRADRIIIDKSRHQLILLEQNRPIKTYAVALGRESSGRKEREGDGKTPEGLYRIDSRKADSAYHLALHISYPNAQDMETAKTRGVSPGGAIMIHGIRNGLGKIGKLHRLTDWTAGCIAVTNREIEEIWRAIPDGSPVEIRP